LCFSEIHSMNNLLYSLEQSVLNIRIIAKQKTVKTASPEKLSHSSLKASDR
jgi:hypothetical protein